MPFYMKLFWDWNFTPKEKKIYNLKDDMYCLVMMGKARELMIHAMKFIRGEKGYKKNNNTFSTP